MHGQLIDGIVFGLGMALHEETHVDSETGRIVAARVTDDRMPVNADIPGIETLVPNVELTSNPLGAKAAAVAVSHATGPRVGDVADTDGRHPDVAEPR